MLYNCRVFILRIVIWNYNHLRRIIIISYFKPYNCVQTSDIIKERPCGIVVAKALDCDIVESSNTNHAVTLILGLMLLSKV